MLEATLEEAGKLRSSCGFLLVAIDKLDRINEAYGFDIADEVIAAVARRVRSQLRGKDHLGRFSGNKFGIILNNCTPDDLRSRPTACWRACVTMWCRPRPGRSR